MKQVILTLTILASYHITGQVLDYKEYSRYLSCTLKTNDFEGCSLPERKSGLYRLFLKLEIPRLHDCLSSTRGESAFCDFFKIQKSY